MLAFGRHIFVQAIDDPQLETLLDSGWKLDHSKFSELASMDDIDALAEVAQNADLSSVRPQLADLLRILRSAGIFSGVMSMGVDCEIAAVNLY
jgi:hypothetical protein